MTSTVWTFTNKKELNKSQFIDYVERKVFRTIRKYNMLPEDRIIKIKKLNTLNTIVLKKIIEKKFEVKFSEKPNLSSDNLSQIAEDAFKNILKGNFKNQMPHNAPLSQLSDKEVELYAKLTGLKGEERSQDQKIQTLFKKFIEKNQDLEVNIVKAMNQIK